MSVTADATAGRATKASVLGGSLRRNRRWALILSYVFLLVFAVFFLLPPYYMLVTSLKSSAEIASMSTNPWYVALWNVTVENYKNLLGQAQFMQYFWNTVIVTVLVVAISMVTSVLAAYSLSRLKFWGSGLLATGVFLTYLVPETLLFIPLFQIVGNLGLLNTYWSLVVVYPTIAVPFCTWIMIGYFASIPKELDEAALIDGAGQLRMLITIFIPVAMPGIIAATIFAFTVSWGNFLYPMAFIYSTEQLPLTAGIVTTLIKGDVFQWGSIMAGALLAAAPPVILYAFLMDYYIAGLTAGATKG
jgi:multiple sugar transport system permease protein